MNSKQLFHALLRPYVCCCCCRCVCVIHTSDDRMCCPSLEWRVGPVRVPSIVYRNDNLRLEICRSPLSLFSSSFVSSVHKCLMSLVRCAIIFFFFVCFSGRTHALLFTTVKYNDQIAGSHDKPNEDEFLSLLSVCASFDDEVHTPFFYILFTVMLRTNIHCIRSSLTLCASPVCFLFFSCFYFPYWPAPVFVYFASSNMRLSVSHCVSLTTTTITIIVVRDWSFFSQNSESISSHLQARHSCPG